MNLDDMSIDELKTFRKSIAGVEKAADVLADLPASDGGAVRISLQPGERATLTTAWVMPAAGERDGLGGPILLEVEDEPRSFAAHGMVGGSGDLQRHGLAECPPAEPAASTPETGASPEAIPRAEAPTGEAVAAADPVGEPPRPRATVSSVSQPEPWTEQDEAYLVVLVADRLAAGDTRKTALEKAAALIGRTANACDFRLRSRLEERLQKAVEHQRGERAKRAAGLAKVVAEAPEKPSTEGAITAPPAPAPAPPPPAEHQLTIAQRGILDTLGRLSGRKGFDAEIDLEIVEGFARGTKTAALALDLDLDAPLLLARFRDLTACIRDARGNMTIDGQADLMKVLRHRVKEARGIAA
ncbi:hypothetical protein [Haematobacter genomosp. 1]|uniref:Uncharacterized protein n=1 Tax=Haematobacter genomosp. 1 TaxID=366618 RepID=A0A212ABY9_9RHOB|nr:hypothetical protein [Haematobacter genomosp. 1]OWJ78406.1 hypothetical protein CDV49_08185 [Haematobacter genomosp. 1]